MSNDHMDESTCTLHRSIPDRFDEVPTGHNVTCERINFAHEQQRQLLARQPFEQHNAAPFDLHGNHNGRPHDSIYTSFQPPDIANGLEADGTTNGLLDPTQQDQGLWVPYTDWLQSDDPVYWIAGHQRAGKSTLMRFLRDDRTIHTRARLWASGSRLVKICFFLRQPTSYRDFLSELLYRAADGRPDMFNDLPPLRMKDEELVHVFEDTFDELGSGDYGKFLLMLDGVEHLEDGGNKLSMLLWGLLERIDSPGSSLKVCVSTTYDTSQLWQAFRPSLHMEHLTRLDLWQTISDELNDNKEFCQLCKFDSNQARDAVRLIVKHAQGSFLYARLAVAWLVAKLLGTEDISRWCKGNPEAIKELSDSIPGTFEGIFKNILAHEWPSGPSALTLFGLFGQAEREKEPLPLLVLSFAEEPYDEDMEPGIRAATCSEIDQRLCRIRRHFFIRCGGLLEAPDAGDDTMVHSRHDKTAGERKDKTLETPYPADGALAPVRHHEVVGEWKEKMWELINNHSKSPPNPLHLQRDLCAAYLRRIKSLDTTKPTFFASFRSLATACLKYSIKVEEPLGKENGPGENPNLKILLALNKDAKSILAMPQPRNAKSPEPSQSDPRPWSVKVQSNQHAYLTIHPHWTNVCEIVNYQPPSSFFDFALQHGLYSIVDHRLKKRPNTNGNGNGHAVQNHQRNGTVDGQIEMPERVHRLVSGRILPLTLIARTQHTTANLQPISIKMARILFKHGADPNYKQPSEAPGTTAWQALLKAMAAEMPKERSTGGEQNKPATDGDAKPPTPEQVKADRKKRDADQARRIRLAQLAILFLENGADPYATVRQMEPSDGGAGSCNDKAAASAHDKQSPVLLFVKGLATCVRDNVVTAARGVRSVPTRLQRFRVRVKEMKALTRDVDSQKLTVDEIVGAMWKSHEGDAMDEGSVGAGDIALREEWRDFDDDDDDDAEGEEENSSSSTENNSSEDDNASERAVARAKKEAELWKRVLEAVQNKRRDSENRDKKIRKKVLRERAWERARLFAR